MTSTHQLIRHIRFANQVKLGRVAAQVFKCDRDDAGSGLSVTRCRDEISSTDEIREYRQEVCRHPAGLLGLCFVHEEQLSDLGLALTDDPHDLHRYGHLHALLSDPRAEDRCPTELMRRELATCATTNGSVVPMEPHRDG